MLDRPSRAGTQLDLLFTSKEEPVMDVITNGCSYHKTVESEVLRREMNDSSRIHTLDLRKADFGLFTKLLWQVPLKAALKDKENLAGLEDSFI